MGNKLPASFKMRVRTDCTPVPIPRRQCSLDETYLSWMPNPPAARTNGASMTALILLKMNFKSARQTALTSANPDWFPNKVHSSAMKPAALLNEQKTHPYVQSVARKDVFCIIPSHFFSFLFSANGREKKWEGINPNFKVILSL